MTELAEAMTLIEGLRHRIQVLQTECEALKRKNAELQNKIEAAEMINRGEH